MEVGCATCGDEEGRRKALVAHPPYRPACYRGSV